MDALLIIIALALPALMGSLWLNLFVPTDTAARPALVWGMGTLLGLLLLPQLMRLLDALGMGLNFVLTSTVMAALCAVALALRARRAPPAAAVPRAATGPGTGAHLLFYCLLGLIALRVVNLGLEIYYRPLFPWDATMHWATKARVWFEYQAMVPFVHHPQWLDAYGQGVFTDRHPEYPATVPLLQVWINLALGRWDESLMNLPWVACLAALGLAFYGQLRLARANSVTAIAFTYLLLSMPLLNIHVALAGYADLFLGAAYCCALVCFHHWCRDREPWLAIVAVLFLMLCPLIKNEGLIWAATLLPAAGIVLLPRKEVPKFFLLLALLAVLVILAVPDRMVIAGTTLNQLQPRFNPAGLTGTITSVWLHDNWHLLGYLFLASFPVILLLHKQVASHYLGILTALATAVGGFLFLFLFTGFAWGASNHTAVGRLCMHLMPALLFMAALLYTELVARQQQSS